jgi:hypothetical protein
MLSVVDVESGQRLRVQTSSPALRQRYAAAAADRQEQIRRSIAEAGGEQLVLSTDRDWLVDVVKFVGRRRTERFLSPAGRRAGRVSGGSPRVMAGAPPIDGGAS